MKLALYATLAGLTCSVLVIVPHLVGKILFPSGSIYITESMYFTTDIFMFMSGAIYCDVTRTLKNKIWRK